MTVEDPVEEQQQQVEARSERSFFAKYCCGFGNPDGQYELANSPDTDFHADSLIKLTHGVTAYRIIEPKDINSRAADSVPIIVCLHGLLGCSYMWADIADLLSDFEQGPQARVLVFDFYGRGRSPWTGVDITLDTLVSQTKELMDCKFMHFLLFVSSYNVIVCTIFLIFVTSIECFVILLSNIFCYYCSVELDAPKQTRCFYWL